MKIVIVGPGALGCLFAGFLSKNPDNLVWLLDKDPVRAELLKKTGIKISGLSKISIPPKKINVTADPKEIIVADLVIILVKSYDTESAVKNVLPCVNKDTILVSLQNGLGNIEIIRSFFTGKNHPVILSGVTSLGATTLETGKIIHAGAGKTFIGVNRKQRLEPAIRNRIKNAFRNTGINILLTNDIEPAVWSKLVMNSAINPLAAITQMSNGELVDNCYVRDNLQQAAKESALVAKALGIKLLFKNPEKEVVNGCMKSRKNRNSMLQDILNKKQTEIEYINGTVIKFAEKMKLETPVNKNLYSRVKSIEAGSLNAGQKNS